jgi:chromosome segregation ATPase
MKQQPPKKIRVHREDSEICEDGECGALEDDYILLSEHQNVMINSERMQKIVIKDFQKQLEETKDMHGFALDELLKVKTELRTSNGNMIVLKKQLAEKDKEIKSNCEQYEAEKQNMKKVIDHWRQSYNQAADERNELKIMLDECSASYQKAKFEIKQNDKMLVAMAKKLKIPKNVKMAKMEKCAACSKKLVLHCPDDCE